MKRAVVLGGGYAGVAAARALAGNLPSHWHVALVDRRDAHELVTRLPEIVAGRLDPDLARIPFRLALPERVETIRATVTQVDVDGHALQTEHGAISWDRLILATGVEAWVDEHVRVSTDTFSVRSVGQAVALRDALRQLSGAGNRPRIVIVGAGYTAAEVAGELLAPGDGGARFDVTLVADQPRMLPNGNGRLAAVADATLRRAGARIVLGVQPIELGDDHVRLSDGRAFPADLVVWGAAAAGARAWAQVFPTVDQGKLRVNEFLETGAAGVLAAGDIVWIPGVAASAQFAIEEGSLAAANVVRTEAGEAPRAFRPRTLGEALSLGPNNGVAEILGVVVTGRRALAVKSAALARYLFRLGGTSLVREYTGRSVRGSGR